MRKIISGFAVPALSACLFTAEEPASKRPLAGAYRGDHGAVTRFHGLESELVLEKDGAFRYFLIDSNTTFYTAKGRWTATENDMVLTGVSRAYLYHGGFRRWETLVIPDTCYLRNVTDSGFQRLELTYDTLSTAVLRWVDYLRIPAQKPLPEGAYEFAETYLDGVDSTLKVDGLTRIEIAHNRPYSQKIFRDGVLIMSDLDSSWTQAGTHLITTRNRHCEFKDGRTSCSDAPPDYEYLTRLADVGDSAFRLWIAPSFTFQPHPLWADFRKVP